MLRNSCFCGRQIIIIIIIVVQGSDMEGDEDFDPLVMDEAFHPLTADDDLYVQLEEMLPSGSHVMFGDGAGGSADRAGFPRSAYQMPFSFTDGGANDNGEFMSMFSHADFFLNCINNMKSDIRN